MTFNNPASDTASDAPKDAANDIANDAIGSTPLLEEATASGESFLRFYLLSDLPVLLSVYQLAEILTLSLSQIAPMFEMPPWVIGVHNWRGEVLWMIDLNHFLGLTPWYQQPECSSKHTVVILKSHPQTNSSVVQKEAVLGLVVNRVEDMVLCPSDSIQPLSNQPLPDRLEAMPEIQPFLRGYWRDSTEKSAEGSAEEPVGEVNLVLEGAAILSTLPTSDYWAISDER
jgi:positive phototaxis protein PixI